MPAKNEGAKNRFAVPGRPHAALEGSPPEEPHKRNNVRAQYAQAPRGRQENHGKRGGGASASAPPATAAATQPHRRAAPRFAARHVCCPPPHACRNAAEARLRKVQNASAQPAKAPRHPPASREGTEKSPPGHVLPRPCTAAQAGASAERGGDSLACCSRRYATGPRAASDDAGRNARARRRRAQDR